MYPWKAARVCMRKSGTCVCWVCLLVHERTGGAAYRGTSLIRNNPSLGPYSGLMPRALWWS